ncbi:MAG: hypothetical protein CMB56_006195 [Methanobacteriota archaeon]|nr:MAG: hypothetical protein CMB56_006195 [Euryarchaeota archaeon]|tara:strand:- start:3370 stop:4701 length:1332 start_codon:yes stop_codon:yes gene_type:complete
MEDINISSDLDGGMFGLTTPVGWGGWIMFVLGFILSVIGILTLLGFLHDDPPLPILTAVGVLLIAFSSPTKLQKTLRELRAKTLPLDVNWQQQKGGTELTSFWNSATINRPKVNDRSWVFPAPKREKWHLENRYAADEPEELIQEHPNKIGTPRPPTISNYAVATPIAFGLLAYQLTISMVEEEQMLIYILIGIATLWLLASFFMWRRAQSMMDTPTSTIRSVAVGGAEIVGQVRDGPQYPSTVVVDGDNSKSVDDLVAWRWNYEVYKCRKVTTTDSNGKTTTREECNWHEIRSDAGGTTFTIHDGTGGVAVLPNTFSSKEYGTHLIQWECKHDFRMKGLFTNIMLSGDIRRHRWTLWGLKIGDPCYLLATLKNREEQALQAENIDRTLQNSLLEAVGEKAPGFRPRLEKGTELTALGSVKSELEYLIIPTIALLASIIMLGV